MEHDGLAKNLRKTPGHIDSQRKNGDYTRMLVMLKKQQVQRNIKRNIMGIRLCKRK